MLLEFGNFLMFTEDFASVQSTLHQIRCSSIHLPPRVLTEHMPNTIYYKIEFLRKCP